MSADLNLSMSSVKAIVTKSQTSEIMAKLGLYVMVNKTMKQTLEQLKQERFDL